MHTVVFLLKTKRNLPFAQNGEAYSTPLAGWAEGVPLSHTLPMMTIKVCLPPPPPHTHTHTHTESVTLFLRRCFSKYDFLKYLITFITLARDTARQYITGSIPVLVIVSLT